LNGLHVDARVQHRWCIHDLIIRSGKGTAGPFDKLRAGYSTAQFAKYRELLRSG
jgi:hypothetical protein